MYHRVERNDVDKRVVEGFEQDLMTRVDGYLPFPSTLVRLGYFVFDTLLQTRQNTEVRRPT